MRRNKATVVDSSGLMQDYIAVATALVVDAAKAEARAIGKLAEASERRAFARALFALIEGLTYCQRQLAEADDRLASVARARAKAASKHARRVGQKAGDRETVALNVRAAFAATAAAHQVANPIGTAVQEWLSFRQGIAIRNRVTHPKSGRDCAVSEADVRLLRRVHEWYFEATGTLMESITASRNLPANGVVMNGGTDPRLGARRR